MPEHDHPPTHEHLTTSGARGRVAALLVAAHDVPDDAAFAVADGLDLVSGALLAAVGVTGHDARRAVLERLWTP